MRVLDVPRFIVGFGLARAIPFIAPIILSNLLPTEHYGQFELAQSYATIGVLLFGFGLSGTVPLIRLRDEIEGRWDTLLLLVAMLAGVSLLFAGWTAAGLGALYAVPVLIFLAIAVLMMQGFWANTLKSEGRLNSAVFVESGFWLAALAGATLVALSGGRLAESVIVLMLLIYAVALMAVTLSQFARARTMGFSVLDLQRNVALGLPLMFTGILTAVVVNSGRLILGPTSGTEAVALYAVLYRATILPLVGHQILVIGLFRQIFAWPEHFLRQRAPVIVVGTSAMVLAFWLLQPIFGRLLGQRFAETFGVYRTEGLILLVQTILWSAIAINDLLNSRHQIAGRVAVVTAPYLLLGLAALGLQTLGSVRSREFGSLLEDFVVWHFFLMAGFFALQCLAAWRLGHRYLRLWLTVIGCTICTGTLIFIGERFL